jgi:methylase of polypeptide subunit release factors
MMKASSTWYAEEKIVKKGSQGIFPEMSDLILRNLKTETLKGKRVLDVGCGNGLLSLACAEKGAAQITGIDANPKAIEWAQEAKRHYGYKQVHFKTKRIEKLNESTRYNWLLCNAAQLPLPRPYNFFGEGDYFVGLDGRAMIAALLNRLPELLAHQGKLWLIHTDLAQLLPTLRQLNQMHFSYRVLDGMRLPLYTHVAQRMELVEYLQPMLSGRPGDYYFRFYLLEINRRNELRVG